MGAYVRYGLPDRVNTGQSTSPSERLYPGTAIKRDTPPGGYSSAIAKCNFSCTSSAFKNM